MKKRLLALLSAIVLIGGNPGDGGTDGFPAHRFLSRYAR